MSNHDWKYDCPPPHVIEKLKQLPVSEIKGRPLPARRHDPEQARASTYIGIIIGLALAACVVLIGCPHAKGEVVIVTGPNCYYCELYKPVYRKLWHKHDIMVEDTSYNPEALREYGVSRIPCTIVRRAGREIGRVTGCLSEQHLLQLCKLAEAKPIGHWEARPAYLASLVGRVCWEWVWVSEEPT